MRLIVPVGARSSLGSVVEAEVPVDITERMVPKRREEGRPNTPGENVDAVDEIDEVTDPTM